MDISQALLAPSSKKGKAHFFSNDPLSGLDKTDPKVVGAKFESIFYRMILKQIRESELDDGLFTSNAMKTRKEMQDDELANVLGGAGHLGIMKMIEDFTAKVTGEGVVHPNAFSKNLEAPQGLIKEVKS
ncbi:hypothetical protein SCG7109_AB_00560 [Chlamydiales bacterium SCGC AG-110-M15]|nr:hypothetical protein SCG7109_AB_00560 [Chlamydiales bacterium SCGC AG-110-M15]